jgi:hypothetical protein
MFWKFYDLKDCEPHSHDWLYFVLYCVIMVGGMVAVALIERGPA